MSGTVIWTWSSASTSSARSTCSPILGGSGHWPVAAARSCGGGRPTGDPWVRHLFAADDLSRDKLYGHIRRRKRRGEFLSFLRYLRRLYPPTIRIAIVLDNYSPHLFHHR